TPAIDRRSTSTNPHPESQNRTDMRSKYAGLAHRDLGSETACIFQLSSFPVAPLCKLPHIEPHNHAGIFLIPLASWQHFRSSYPLHPATENPAAANTNSPIIACFLNRSQFQVGSFHHEATAITAHFPPQARRCACLLWRFHPPPRHTYCRCTHPGATPTQQCGRSKRPQSGGCSSRLYFLQMPHNHYKQQLSLILAGRKFRNSLKL